jgi:hypothetical protein
MNESEIARTVLERFKNHDLNLKKEEIDEFLKWANNNASSQKEAYALASKYEIISKRNALIAMSQYQRSELQYYIVRVFSLCVLENQFSEGLPLTFKAVQGLQTKLNLHMGRCCFWESSGAKNIERLKDKLMRLILLYSVASIDQTAEESVYFSMHNKILIRANTLKLLSDDFLREFNIFYSYLQELSENNKDNSIFREIFRAINFLIPLLFSTEQSDTVHIREFIYSCNKMPEFGMPILYFMGSLLKMTNSNLLKQIFDKFPFKWLTEDLTSLRNSLFSFSLSNPQYSPGF